MEIDEYVDEFYKILGKLEDRNREGDFDEDEVALGILRERAKDRRMAAMEDRRQNRGEPASEKQKNYMDDLGIVYEEGITKEEASREIEKALDSGKQ
ncbi:MAG: hypothetical protein ACOCZP_02425 [Candidatus Hadarchaeota archaeon]